MGKEAEDNASDLSDAPNETFDSRQYRFLLACCQAGDVDRWNRWRRANLAREVRLAGADLAGRALDGFDLSGVRLDGADLSEAGLAGASLAAARLRDATLWMARLDGAHLLAARLDRANLRGAGLEDAVLISAGLSGADLSGARLARAALPEARLSGADLSRCDLSGADLSEADLRGADLSFAVVDASTLLAGCAVDRQTDFAGVDLASARVSPGLRQLLAHSTRREQWLAYCRRGPWPARAIKTALCLPFWWLSDYGRSTWRIVLGFAVLAMAFATALGAWPQWVTADGAAPKGIGFLHAVYLTVATMTSLGLGDVGLRPAGAAGQVLLAAEMLVGYVILAALVARFVVMFTAAGPADAYAPSRNAPWRRVLRRLLADPRHSRLRPVRQLARALCEPNRIGRPAVACLLRLSRRLTLRPSGPPAGRRSGPVPPGPRTR